MKPKLNKKKKLVSITKIEKYMENMAKKFVKDKELERNKQLIEREIWMKKWKF